MEPKFNNTNKNPIALTIKRMELKMTRAELAERSGVNIRNIEYWEQRRCNISDAKVSSILAVAKVLGCTVEELID